MTVPRRTLSITFERSITAGVPNTMEIAVLPLGEPGAPELEVSLVGGTQSKTIVLANTANTVTFDLVPTDSPQLNQRVIYRIGWRERYIGRQYTSDFVMPDADVSFADLQDLGAILGGVAYLQWTDRGSVNGVAALDALGRVLDGDGNPIVSATGGASAQSFTASRGVQKVTTTNNDGLTTYDFRLDPDTAVRKYHGLVIPASGNFGTVVHNLGSQHVLVTIRDTASRLPVAAVCRPNLDGNTIAVEFASPPVNGQYTAVVLG